MLHRMSFPSVLRICIFCFLIQCLLVTFAGYTLCFCLHLGIGVSRFVFQFALVYFHLPALLYWRSSYHYEFLFNAIHFHCCCHSLLLSSRCLSSQYCICLNQFRQILLQLLLFLFRLHFVLCVCNCLFVCMIVGNVLSSRSCCKVYPLPVVYVSGSSLLHSRICIACHF